MSSDVLLLFLPPGPPIAGHLLGNDIGDDWSAEWAKRLLHSETATQSAVHARYIDRRGPQALCRARKSDPATFFTKRTTITRANLGGQTGSRFDLAVFAGERTGRAMTGFDSFNSDERITAGSSPQLIAISASV